MRHALGHPPLECACTRDRERAAEPLELRDALGVAPELDQRHGARVAQPGVARHALEHAVEYRDGLRVVADVAEGRAREPVDAHRERVERARAAHLRGGFVDPSDRHELHAVPEVGAGVRRVECERHAVLAFRLRPLPVVHEDVCEGRVRLRHRGVERDGARGGGERAGPRLGGRRRAHVVEACVAVRDAGVGECVRGILVDCAKIDRFLECRGEQ
jgi:hypothetical protein